MSVLYLLWKLGRPCHAAELSAFPGLTKSAVSFSLARLLACGSVAWETDGGAVRYRFRTPELEEELRQTVEDFRAVAYEGLSEDELAVYRRCTTAIGANIRRRLLAEESGEK